MTRIVLHIDRLVLRGFAHSDRHGVAEGLRQELARALATPETVRQLMARPDVTRLQLGRTAIDHGASPRQVGYHLARSIDRGMKT